MLKELGFIGIFNVNPAIIGALTFFSVLLMAFLIERFWYFMAYAGWSEDFWHRLKSVVQAGRLHEARSMCAQSRSVFAQTFGTAIASTNLSRADNEDVTDIAKDNQLDKLRARLGVFSTLSFISPLVGLLGTVTGIMQAFSDLSKSGSGGANIVAAGISEALVATAAGIVVAVPAAIFYNYFTLRVRAIGSKLTNYSHELIILMYGGEETGQRQAQQQPKASEVRANSSTNNTVEEPVSEINVTPLADVTLVLLIILMLLSPLAMQSMIQVQAASVVSSSKGGVSEKPLFVDVTTTGFTLNNRPVASELELFRLLQRNLAARRDRTVLVSSAPDVAYENVVRILDMVKQSGAMSLSLVPRKKESSAS